jgi:hypothetical protein
MPLSLGATKSGDIANMNIAEVVKAGSNSGRRFRWPDRCNCPSQDSKGHFGGPT